MPRTKIFLSVEVTLDTTVNEVGVEFVRQVIQEDLVEMIFVESNPPADGGGITNATKVVDAYVNLDDVQDLSDE